MPDESATGVSATDKKRANGRAKSYGPGAQRDQQPRLADLVPRRYLTFSILGALGILVIGLLEFAFVRLPRLGKMLPADDLIVFDLSDRRSLASAYTAFLLSLTGVTSLLVYSLRRHRIDDYHGRYRIWLWSGLVWLTLGFHQATGVLNVVRSVLVASMQHFGLPARNLLLALSATVVVILGLRLLLEVRRLRSVTLLGTLAAILLVANLAMAAGWNVSASGEVQVALRTGMQMAGSLAMLTAIGLYARRVVREVEGLVDMRKKKSKGKAQKPADAKSAAEHERQTQTGNKTGGSATVQSGAFKPATSGQSTASPGKPASSETIAGYDDEDDDDDGHSGLTRAERKRLRRERKLEQRRAA